MTTPTILRGSNTTSTSCLRLDTLPPEIRAIIYTHLCNPICLEVECDWADIEFNIKDYPWQLSAVSHLLRDEALPILLGKSTVRPLHLICQDGSFPDYIRRRIPNRVLDGISSITIEGQVRFDDLKPSLTTFPNLRQIRIDISYLHVPPALAKSWLRSEKDGLSSEEVRTRFMQHVKQIVLSQTEEMKRMQEMPREGLERDYYVDGTLYEVLQTTRERRGFDVTLQVTVGSSVERFLGTFKMDSWDIETSASFERFPTILPPL